MTNNPTIERYDKPNGYIIIKWKDFCLNSDVIPETMIFKRIFQEMPLRLLEKIKKELDYIISDRKGLNNDK